MNDAVFVTGDGYNRVGRKRSSFLPTFVFCPLTPPYVRFRIRRFLSADAIERINPQDKDNLDA